MPWCWQLPDWPIFRYDPDKIAPLERKFLLSAGSSFAIFKNLDKNECDRFTVEILSIEGQQSSQIEGVLLERESLQSSIRAQFGLKTGPQKKSEKERGMAEVLTDVYRTFDQPLSHKMMWSWHSMLFKSWAKLEDLGTYRTHNDPMQIVAGRLDDHKVYYEAPPSKDIVRQMEQFVTWYNASSAQESSLVRASLVHLYFECIHPFEDGNGRIGRLLVEKALSQGLGQPVLIAVSKCIEKRKKDYYAALARCNTTLEIDPWIEFFSEVIIQAQEESMKLLHFLLAKSKMLTSLSGKLNPRQEKALMRMFAEGPEGFIGGLSAQKYIAITKAPRATTTRDLNDLIEKGALIKTGELRHTRYWLNISDSCSNDTR